MAHSPPARKSRGGNTVLWIALGIAGLILVGLAGRWAYLRFTGHDMTGLEGVWHDANDGNRSVRQGYDFQPDGTVSAWNGNEKSFWNTIGWDATWRRTGDEITIKTDRNWNFVGKLEGDTLRGTMTVRSYPDWSESTAEMVWRKE